MNDKIIKLDIVDSTNRYAIEHFAEFADGTLIIADEQTAGRGRRGRSWVSPPKTNIYASYVIKNLECPLQYASFIASVATIQTLREFSKKLPLWIKWPNDIFCGNRKISGSLCEVKSNNKNEIQGIIVGIGINLNTEKDILDKIEQPATSLLIETSSKIKTQEFVKKLEIRLKESYNKILSGEKKSLFEEWKKEIFLIGKTVEVIMDNNSIEKGKILDINEAGNPIFFTNETIKILQTGDISINKEILKNFDFKELEL